MKKPWENPEWTAVVSVTAMPDLLDRLFHCINLVYKERYCSSVVWNRLDMYECSVTLRFLDAPGVPDRCDLSFLEALSDPVPEIVYR